MEKRQATEFLEYLLRDRNIEGTIYEDALNIAIESLKAQLSHEGATSDLISRQAVLDAIVQCTNCGDEDTLREYVLKHSLDNGWTGGILEALDTVKDLPPAQPELSHTQKSCEYCHEDSDGYTRPIEKNCHAYIRFGMNGWEIDLKAKGWHGEAQIKFCPMCGRELQGGR